MKTLMLASLAFCATLAHAADVQRLNDTLKKQNAKWFAKDTGAHFLGLPAEESSVQFTMPEYRTRANLPAVLDWRNKDGLNWVSPILDQANCGSCVAFASIATLETQYKIASGFPTFNIKLSPQNLFACGGGSCGFGWYPDSAARYLQRTGVPDEACQPYTSGATGEDVACNAACPDRQSRSVRIASYSTPTRRVVSRSAIREALQNGPLVTTLTVYEDFMNYGGGVYQHTTGNALGGHAISIIGYDDVQRAYIIRNSWGKTWGENGFGLVSYDDVSGVADQTWSYAMPAFGGAVTVQQPLDYDYLSGPAEIRAHSTYANTDSLELAISGSSSMNVTCKSNDCASTIDTTKLLDGHYAVVATAKDASANVLGKSTVQQFFVSNVAPTLGLSFVGVNGTNLDRPLSDRIEVAVTATSSSVPMSSVDFHWRGADGVDHLRAAGVVVDGLTMGWRTNLVPNGAYEIWMVGHVKTTITDTVFTTPVKTVQVRN